MSKPKPISKPTPTPTYDVSVADKQSALHCKRVVELALGISHRSNKQQISLYLLADEVDYKLGLVNTDYLTHMVNKTWKTVNCDECESEVEVEDPENTEPKLCARCEDIFN